MFSLGAFSGASFIAADPEEPRTPPASPTPVSFPQYDQHTTSPRPWSSNNPPPDLNYLFSHTTRHVDIKSSHLDVLNVNLSSEPCSAGDLIPRGVNDTDFYPHWQVPSVPDEESLKVGPNGRPLRPVLTIEERLRKDFIERLSELETENDTAFRVLNKRNLPGVRPPRIATMRKFWAQLENLSHYWDVSLDDYFQVMEAEPDVETQEMNIDPPRDHSGEQPSPTVKSPKRPRVDDGTKAILSGVASETQDSKCDRDDNGDTIMTDDDPSVTSDPDNAASNSTPDSAQPGAMREKRQYKGRRLGTGRDMPDRFRSDAILAFVEGCVWPFNSTVIPPRRAPAVRFGNLNIPIKQIASVYRLPNDVARRRAGWIQGPLIGLQSRLEVEFSVENRQDDDEADALNHDVLPSRTHPAITARMRKEKASSSAVSTNSEKMDVDIVDSAASLGAGAVDAFQKPALPSSLSSFKARAAKKKPPPVVEPVARGRLDILREIGLLLEIAQERYREGKTESRPGAGQWWTEKPRWGGGKGGPVGDADKPGDKSPSIPSGGADSPSGIDPNATAARPTVAVPQRPSPIPSAAIRQVSAASATTLDFSSLRNKNGTSSTTIVNGLGRPSSSSNKDPSPTHEAAKPTKDDARKPSSASGAPIHPSLPTTSSLPPPSLMKSPNSSSIDPILAAAATPSASFANEMFARHQRRERKSPAAMWETLRCPTATWDAKTEYRAIGKGNISTNPPSSDATAPKDSEEKASMSKNREDMSNSGQVEGPNAAKEEYKPPKTASQAANRDGWDEVFIVSSLNHHISILRLSVHDAYLECLLTGKMPSSSSSSSSSTDPSTAGLSSSEKFSEEAGEAEEKRHWSIPRIRRSKWYDLLNAEDRCEAFRVLWGIMAYLCRDETI
ncbi:uncharacterized protein K489DRAFT_44741 [Dissoconium aciculare CBS 342.82]|uniref:Uncharacterized protein n=1 Tax=Dissoconium aciculare CBS 342.82 TaxID=1314786 RepID=A0A6J3M1Q1_9PEZI|nr:uncharacterized protein K489DRAFT_44741 [Dissoconium aciculare CBS 342.82]KAF1820852.1 hypothetical protein K489DRAFT_44741 [Dissoconium aciculare CBS 342.82]